MLPFQGLNDNQLILINNVPPNNNELLPLNVLETLTFNPFNLTDDQHMNEPDPDNYLINSLHYNYPSCNYIFPKSLSSQLPHSDYSLICYNINSLPLHFDYYYYGDDEY